MSASLQPSSLSVLRRRTRVLDDDLTSWPSVDEDQMADRKAKTHYRTRRDAIEALCNGAEPAMAAAIASTSVRNLRRLLKRCREIAPDGRPWGFRALVPGKRIAMAVRSQLLKVVVGKPQAGFTGAFSLLLRTYPSIQHGLVDALGRLGERQYRQNTMVGRQLQLRFEQLCVEAGLTTSDYPLNTTEKCRRTLPQWIKRVYLPRYVSNFVKAEHGQDAATAYDFERDGDIRRSPPKPWDQWQIDEVKVDVCAAARCPLPAARARARRSQLNSWAVARGESPRNGF